MTKKINFLNLGKHPITNNFLKLQNPKKEFFYNLQLIFNSETKLVSLKKFVSPKRMFNDKYAHRASASETMRSAYSKLAKSIKKMLYHFSLVHRPAYFKEWRIGAYLTP